MQKLLFFNLLLIFRIIFKKETIGNITFISILTAKKHAEKTKIRVPQNKELNTFSVKEVTVILFLCFCF